MSRRVSRTRTFSSTSGSSSRWRKSWTGGDDEQQAEDQEHEREGGDQRGAEGDEDRAHDERGEDAERQHALLVLGGHGERRQDHPEDEQVVDEQARDQADRGRPSDHCDVEHRASPYRDDAAGRTRAVAAAVAPESRMAVERARVNPLAICAWTWSRRDARRANGRRGLRRGRPATPRAGWRSHGQGCRPRPSSAGAVRAAMALR